MLQLFAAITVVLTILITLLELNVTPNFKYFPEAPRERWMTKVTYRGNVVDHLKENCNCRDSEIDANQNALSNHETNGDTLRNRRSRVSDTFNAFKSHGNGGDSKRTREKQHCVKSLHIFANRSYFDMPSETRLFSYILETKQSVSCSPLGQHDCELQFSIGTNFTDLEGKDAVVFGMNGEQWTLQRNFAILDKLVQMEPEPGQTWIFYSIEPPFRPIRWSQSLQIARLKYHVLMSYNREADVRLPFGYYQAFTEEADWGANSVVRTSGAAAYWDVVLRNRTGLISWMTSNCKDIMWPRIEFIKALQKVLPQLDTYGKCGDRECLPKRSNKCKVLMSSYKFYLALPNSECNDYITEKFWDYSLKSGAIPVVLGARKRDYEAVAPPNSFIHIADFTDLQHLADYLIMLDANDHLYAKFHEWRKRGDVRAMFPTPSLFCSAVPMIKKTRTHKDLKLLGDSPWYRGCREIPEAKHVSGPVNDLDNWTMWR